jgi:anaerobic selenocysteine-containing dehydrogenase
MFGASCPQRVDVIWERGGMTCTKLTSCRCCSANCGMIATFDGDRIVKVEGDRSHPVSRGYTCVKGRAVPAHHYSPARLSFPVIRGQRAGWEYSLDDISNRMRGLIAEHGPDSIGFYSGTAGFFDTMGWWSMFRFFAALGTAQRYTAATVDVAPVLRAAQMVTGFHALQPGWMPGEQDGPSLLLIFGSNPAVSHGYVGSSWANPIQVFRDFRDQGGEAWVFDPRQTRTAAVAQHHVAPLPGSDVFILAWLVRELLKEGFDKRELVEACAAEDVANLRAAVARFDLTTTCVATGLEPGVLQRLCASIRRHGKLAILTGSGLSFGPHGLLSEWLRWALLIITGSADRRGGMFFNPPGVAQFPSANWTDHAPSDGRRDAGPASRPELANFFGERPSTAIADEIEAGNLRALFVFGGNPLTSLPQPDRVKAAFAKLEMLVAMDVVENDVTAVGTHVLPSAWQLERGDIRPMADRIQYAAQLLPAGERKPGWWIYGMLAERLGLDIFGDGIAMENRAEEDVMRAFVAGGRLSLDEIFAGGTHGAKTARVFDWVHEHVLENGRWRLAPGVLLARLEKLESSADGRPRLISGRILNAANSVLLAKHRDGGMTAPNIHISVDLSESENLPGGAPIRVQSENGEVTGNAVVDATLALGTVWINHGWIARNVNHLTAHDQTDTLTTQPFLSAIPVRLYKDAV